MYVVPSFLVVLLIIYLSGVYNIVLDNTSEDLIFWTFSTIIQSFIAFIALLGMITIYKLQILDNNKRSIAESMRGIISHYRGYRPSMAYTTDKIIKDIKGLTDDSSNKDTALSQANEEFKNINKNEFEIKNQAKRFFELTITLIIVTLIALTVTPILTYNIFGAFVLFSIVYMSCISLVVGFKLVIELI